MTTKEGTIGRYLPWFLAVLSLGAGGIHFAMISPHFDEYWVEGAFFAVVAWFQLGWAAAVVLRPTNTLLRVGALVNAAVVGMWIVSRTWGPPIGPNAGVAEGASFVDIFSTGLEVGIVVVCLGLLTRPALAERRATSATAVPLLSVSAAVAVFSALALSPSFASGHTHGSEPGGHGDMATASADGHGHGAAVSNAAVGNTPCEVSKANVPAGEDVGQGSGHGHSGPSAWTPIPDPATRDALAVQVTQSREAAAQYPTVAAAEAAGYRLVTAYIPCIGAHYIKTVNFATGFDPLEPEMLLYDGSAPDSALVGLSYAVLDDPEVAPEGFAGPNDPWHKHDLNGGLCLKNGVVVGGESDSEAECAAKGGAKVGLENLWMNHTWVVPGWESSWGLFSSEHPELGGVTGNILADPTKA
ncbi:MAG: hypothetical protein ACRDWD_16910 [Acidimicrobiia bacterium]